MWFVRIVYYAPFCNVRHPFYEIHRRCCSHVLQIRDPTHYVYLNPALNNHNDTTTGTKIGSAINPPAHAAQSFVILTQQMLETGYSPEDLDSMYALLALVLHTGNLDFVESAATEGHYFDIDVTGPIAELADLIGCSDDDLTDALCTNIIVMRGETIVLKNTVSGARDARDAMAKSLYGRLFSWITNTANKLLNAGRKGGRTRDMKEIGVLDIFGFEDLVVCEWS